MDITYEHMDEAIRDQVVSVLSEMKRNLERARVPNQQIRTAIVNTLANVMSSHYDYVLENVYPALPKYFRCGNQSCNVFQRRTFPVTPCPFCFKEATPVPDAVVKAMARKFDREGLTSTMMQELKYDGLNGCYYFMYAGMYHGVEEDGTIHT